MANSPGGAGKDIETAADLSSLVTRTRFTRFTFITSGGGYSKSMGTNAL